MGDQIETFRALKEFNAQERSARHARWREENLAALRASGLRFEERATAVLFRESGKPRVDFYPHTGRWRIVGAPNGPTRPLSGGARKFLVWYAKQEARRA